MSASDPIITPLPQRASLEHLRKQAKDLVRDQPGLSLSDAQHVIARKYGFASWPRLKVEVDMQDVRRLHASARTGNVDAVREILAAHPELAKAHVSPTDEHEAIHYAARGGHLTVVRVLLEAGADPLKGIYPNRGETTARHLAEAWGHLDVVALMDRHLAEARKASPQSSEIQRLLEREHIVAISAALDANPALLHGADANGNTPLHWGASRGNIDLVRMLLERGAHVDAANPAGFRPIHLALYQKYSPVPHPHVARLLIERGAAVDVWVASALGDAGIVARLLRDTPGAAGPIDIRPWWGGIYPATVVFPLSVAALNGHAQVCQLLLDAGADPDARRPNAYGDGGAGPFEEFGLPLTFAALRNLLPIATLLLDRGADPNPQIMAAHGAIDAALAAGHVPMTALLMGRGAKANANALVDAGYHDEALRRAAEDPEQADHVVWSALLAGKPELVRAALPMMMARPVEPSRWPNLFWQVLRSIARDDAHLARLLEGYALLLRAAPDVNACKHEGGNTLHRLADDYSRRLPPFQRLAYGKLLLEHGVDPNLIDADFQSTPLGNAARNGYGELVELFISHGVDVMRAGQPWATPLAWAEKAGHTDIARKLRAAGAVR